MMSEQGTRHIVETLQRWGETARLMSEHIISCDDCVIAEISGGRGYCSTGDKLWAAEMQIESEVAALTPSLKAAGVDVDEFFREAGFRFYKNEDPLRRG